VDVTRAGLGPLTLLKVRLFDIAQRHSVTFGALMHPDHEVREDARGAIRVSAGLRAGGRRAQCVPTQNLRDPVSSPLFQPSA